MGSFPPVDDQQWVLYFDNYYLCSCGLVLYRAKDADSVMLWFLKHKEISNKLNIEKEAFK